MLTSSSENCWLLAVGMLHKLYNRVKNRRNVEVVRRVILFIILMLAEVHCRCIAWCMSLEQRENRDMRQSRKRRAGKLFLPSRFLVIFLLKKKRDKERRGGKKVVFFAFAKVLTILYQKCVIFLNSSKEA